MTSPAVPAPLRRTSGSRWRVRLGLLAAVAVIAAAVWLLATRESGVTPGPLTNPVGQSIGVGRHTGQVWAYGDAVTWNSGDRPVVLEKIALVNPTPGLDVLDTRVAGPRRGMLSLGSWPQWPTPEFRDVHPVAGFQVAPQSDPAGESGVELLFVLRSDKPGRYSAPGVVVDYRVDGTHYRRYLTYAVGVCVSPSDQPRERKCPTPEHLTEEQIEAMQ